MICALVPNGTNRITDFTPARNVFWEMVTADVIPRSTLEVGIPAATAVTGPEVAWVGTARVALPMLVVFTATVFCVIPIWAKLRRVRDLRNSHAPVEPQLHSSLTNT